MIQLNILSGKKAGTQTVARHFPFRIGRAAENELRLEDDGVWDQHLTLEFQQQAGFNLTTADNALATVNGESVQNRILRNGDIITVGSVKIQFWLAAARQGSLRRPRNFRLGADGRRHRRPIGVDLLAAPLNSIVADLRFVHAQFSMPEMPRAGERHRHARVRPPPRSLPHPAPNRPAGSPPSRPLPPPRSSPSGNGKNASLQTTLPFERQFRLARLPDRDAAGIHAAHLARADAQRPVRAA